MSDFDSGEQQSQFNAGLELARDIERYMQMANAASCILTIEGMRSWLLYLQIIDRRISPRLTKKEHKELLAKVKVGLTIPSVGKQHEQRLVILMRGKLTRYQETLEFLRDKLGLGFKPGDDPSKAMMR